MKARRSSAGWPVGGAQCQPLLRARLREGAAWRRIRSDRDRCGYGSRGAAARNAFKPDAVFNALHGRWGEDGCVQGLLELLEIPYTHSGVLASALAMHKERAKAAFRAAGPPVAHSIIAERKRVAAEHQMARPYVVKPICEGSSVGVFIIRAGDNRPPQALASSDWNLGDEVMVEEYIPGRELTVAVMGSGEAGLRALGVTEIQPAAGFYDYDAKYAPGGSRHVIPPEVPDSVAREAMALAERAHAALGLPRRLAHRFPLRRHQGQQPSGGAGSQHAARDDADFARARAGAICRDEFSRAGPLDGGGCVMRKVKIKRQKATDGARDWLSRFLPRRPVLLLSCSLAVAALAAGVWHGGYIGAAADAVDRSVERGLAARGFAVRKISLSGEERTPADAAYEALAIQPGDPIFAVDPDAARARLLALPWVGDAEVRRQFPRSGYGPSDREAPLCAVAQRRIALGGRALGRGHHLRGSDRVSASAAACLAKARRMPRRRLWMRSAKQTAIAARLRGGGAHRRPALGPPSCRRCRGAPARRAMGGPA